MNGENLTKIFYIFIYLGFAIPILNLLIGAFGFVADFDIDLDADTDFDGIVPFNIMSLCFAFITFGALGGFSVQYMTSTSITFFILVGLALVSFGIYIFFYRCIILKLKNSKPMALNHEDLTGKTGILTLRVTNESDGIISLKDSTGASISYKARLSITIDLDELSYLPQGEEVIVMDFDNNEMVCYVEPLNIVLKEESSKKSEK